MTQEINLEAFLSATSKASKRKLTVVVILVVACVLPFATLWNEREGSWIHKRLSLARDAQHIFELREQKCAAAELNLNPERMRDAEKWAENQHIISSQEINGVIQTLIVRHSKSQVIQVPFFGIGFDVNDLSMMSGLTLVIVLIMLRFCLADELACLKLAFEHIDEHFAQAMDSNTKERKAFYNFLAIQQPLTVPPGQCDSRHKIWCYLPNILYYLPLVTQLSVIVNEIKTIPYGLLISKFNINTAIIIGIISIILIAILVFICIDISKRIDKEWQNKAKEFGIGFCPRRGNNKVE